ncbi:hypothetical protein [Streptomyces sp. NPDC000134]
MRGRRSAETTPHRPVAEGQQGQGQQAVRQAPGEVAGALRDLLAR